MTGKKHKPIRLDVRGLRDAKGLTQQELASLAKVSEKTIKNAESGLPVTTRIGRRIEMALAAQPANDVRFDRPVLHPSGQVWRCPQCFNCYCMNVVACPNDGQMSPLRTKPAATGSPDPATPSEAEQAQAVEDHEYRRTAEHLGEHAKADEAAEDEEKI